MAGVELHLPAKCPRCFASLMSPLVPLDGLPSIELVVMVEERGGYVHLSQVYGSDEALFVGIPDVPGSVETLSCPTCLAPLPVTGPCACGAPLAAAGCGRGLPGPASPAVPLRGRRSDPWRRSS